MPPAHIELIERCVGWFDERPHNAGELLKLMRQAHSEKAAVPTELAPAVAKTVEPAQTAIVTPAEGLRESLLHRLVEDLDKEHKAFAEADRKTGAYLPGALVAAAVAFIVLVTWSHSVWAGIFGGVVVGSMVGAVVHLTWRGRQAEARERLDRTVAMLLGEFPEVVRSWGGETVLRHPDMVARLRKHLGLEATPRSPHSQPSAEPAAEAGQREEMVERLTELAQKQQTARRWGNKRPFPLPVAILAGLVVGVLAGIGLGGLYWGYRGPVSFPGIYLDSRMKELPQGVYHRVDLQTTTIAVLVGIGGGLVLAGATAALLAWRRWYRLGVGVGIALGGVLGTPAGVGVGALHNSFASPYMVMGVPGPSYYDSSGQLLAPAHYQLLWRQTATTGVLIGVSTGLFFVGLGIAVTQHWFGRRARRLTEEARESAEQVAGKYPQVVADLGGAEALKDPEKVRGLLRGMQA